MDYWLIKSEPSVYSIDDLGRAPNGTDHWDGVRNYQARNFLRRMKWGNLAIFYHSNASPPAGVGICRIVREAYPDPTQWDGDSPYYDPKSSKDNPRWSMVDVKFVEKFPRPVSLGEMRASGALDGLPLLNRGNRLSVMPVERGHFEAIKKMALL